MGLVGKKRSGKDTIAKYLVEKYNFHRYAFADPIKEMVKIAFLWDDDWMEGVKKEAIDFRWGISPRQILQHVGTDWAQDDLTDKYPLYAETTGRLLWVKRFIFIMNKANNYVISDVRFPHEVDTIKNSKKLKDVNKYLIRVKRDETDSFIDPHESESYVDGIFCDYTIKNNRSIDELCSDIDTIMGLIL